ncbi:MAG: hypothetical protein HKN91_06710 [Acidimicrobiia bacterium]|nr:hypothetical protein [Acidimicrobiia bacterium]
MKRSLVAMVHAAMTQLAITHDLLFALELCHRSLILDGGVVVADAPTRELLANTGLLATHCLEMRSGLLGFPSEIDPNSGIFLIRRPFP